MRVTIYIYYTHGTYRRDLSVTHSNFSRNIKINRTETPPHERSSLKYLRHNYTERGSEIGERETELYRQHTKAIEVTYVHMGIGIVNAKPS